MYTLYIVECADGTLYTGITTDITRRLLEHNTSERGAKYTRSRRPVNLRYTRRFRTRSRATQEETQMKKLTRADKLKLCF